jgi:integrase
MPRLTNSIPKYRKHRASGQAFVELSGHRHYLGPHGTKASKHEYDRLVAEWLAAGRSPTYGVPESELSIGGLLVAYLTYAKRYYGDAARSEFANMVLAVRPLRELYSRTPAREFGPLQLKAVRERFIAAGHCRSHVNSGVRRIVRVFRWAVSEALLPPEVPQALAMVPGLRRGRSTAPEGRKVMPVDAELVAATLPHLSITVRAMVEIQQLAGCRPGELVILRPGDVDRSGDVWEYSPPRHKTAHHGQERTVYLGPLAQIILRPFLLRPGDMFCFSPIDSRRQHQAERTANRQTPLSCGNRVGTNRVRKPKRQPRERYTTTSYARAISYGCEQAFPVPAEIADDPQAIAGWKRHHHWTPNQLRHSLATRVRREFDIDAAKTLLGHSQIGTTEIYAEKDRRRAIEVAKLIG